MKWKVLQSNYLFKEPWFTVRKEICELPNGKVHSAYYILEYPEWVSIFALTDDNKVLMVRQYRHGLGVISTELPGGVVDAGETPEQAAHRELLEETGFRFDKLEYLGKISPNPATSTNYMHMFFGRDGKKVAGQSLDETEDVEVLYRTTDEVKELLKENKIVQALHISCIFYGMAHSGALSY